MTAVIVQSQHRVFASHGAGASVGGIRASVTDAGGITVVMEDRVATIIQVPTADDAPCAYVFG